MTDLSQTADRRVISFPQSRYDPNRTEGEQETNAALSMKSFLQFSAGAILGAAVMFLGKGDRGSAWVVPGPGLSAADAESSSVSPAAVSSQSTVDERPQGRMATAGDESADQSNALRLPNEYRQLIGSIPPRRPSFPERHAQFAQEPRNEAWAFAMEAGLSNFYAARAPGAGVVIESIECRSENCEIAGYLANGSNGMNSSLYEFTSEPWWNANNAVSVHEFEADGRDLFILVTFPFDGSADQ